MHKYQEKIRNIKAFVYSYLKSEHGKNMLNRPEVFKEETDLNSKGKPVTHKTGITNTAIAEAFKAAV